MLYKAPWGTTFNLNNIKSISDYSDCIRPGFFQAKETKKYTFWQKFWNGYKDLEEGKFYDKFCHEEVSEDIASYPKHCILVWYVYDQDIEFEFDTLEEKEEFLRIFEEHCNGKNNAHQS